MRNQTYCGIDLHRKMSQICMIEEDGKLLEQTKINSNREEFIAYFKNKSKMHCALEPVENWGWAADALEEMGHQVHLAHPYKVRLIAETRVKTDKVDARILADLLRTNYLPESYVAPLELRDQRTFYRHRIRVARDRARLKSEMKRVLRLENIVYPDNRNLFSKKGKQWLEGVELRATHHEIREDTLNLIAHYDGIVSRLDNKIRKISEKDVVIQRLMTIPGIGKLSAQVILSEIGDVSRFATAKHFASYCGLGVSQRSSGGKQRMGHITKQGNRYIRWLLIEGSKKGKCSDANLKKFFDRIAYKKGKSKATVALARKLAEITWHVLRDQKKYDSTKVGRRLG